MTLQAAPPITQAFLPIQGSILRTCLRKAYTSAGIDFINVLQAAFACADSKSAEKTNKLTIFRFSGSIGVKTACRMLMKLTPDSTNALRHSSHQCLLRFWDLSM